MLGIVSGSWDMAGSKTEVSQGMRPIRIITQETTDVRSELYQGLENDASLNKE